MQEEILQLYEKIKDQLSEEEFNAKIEELRENYGDVEFMNDLDLARMILENYGVEVPEVVSSDDSSDGDTIDDSIESDEDTDEDKIQKLFDKVMARLSKIKALEDYMAIIQVAGAVLTESISVEAKGYLNEGKTKIKNMWGGEQNANEGVQKAKE